MRSAAMEILKITMKSLKYRPGRKPMKLNRDVFTTGTLAKLLGCCPRTLVKWCDQGLLPCYRIPDASAPEGKGTDRRFTRKTVCKFLRDHGMEMPAALGSQLLAVGVSPQVLAQLPGAVAVGSLMSLGLVLDREVGTHHIVIDTGIIGHGVCLEAGKALRAALPGMVLVALVPDDLPLDASWADSGYNAALQAPYTGLAGLLGLEAVSVERMGP